MRAMLALFLALSALAASLSPGAAAGAGASVSVVSGTTSGTGVIRLTTGTSPGTGTLFTVNFGTDFSNAGGIGCLLFPANGAAGSQGGVYMTPGNPTVTLSTSVALAPSTLYQWAFLCNQ